VRQSTTARWASVGAIIFLVALWVVVAEPLPAADAATMAWANVMRHPILDRTFLAVTWLGSLAVLAPLTGLVAWRVASRLGWRAACFPAAALLATTALAHATKFAIDRARPDLFPALISMPPDAGFPSAHTAQVAAVALAFLIQTKQAGCRLTAFAAGLLLTVIMVALSRIYLQVHFPSDIIAGIGLAIAVVLGLNALPLGRGVPR
jgi:undecaprenyl-diphosphatase